MGSLVVHDSTLMNTMRLPEGTTVLPIFRSQSRKKKISAAPLTISYFQQQHQGTPMDFCVSRKIAASQHCFVLSMLAKPLEPKQATGCCSDHLLQLRIPLTTVVLSRGHPLYRTEGTGEHLTQRPDSSLARPGALALPAPVCARLTHPHAGVRQRLHGSLEPEPMVLRPPGQALRLSAAHSRQPRMGMADKLSPRLGHGLGPELTLLVSHGGHFEQVGALLHLLGSAD